MHPLLALLMARPQLLVDHVQAYAGLLGDALTQTHAAWRHRLVWQLAGWVCLTVATLLAGAALALWAVTPTNQVHAPWALWLLPALLLAGAAGCFVWAHQATPATPMASLGQQLATDLALWRASGPP